MADKLTPQQLAQLAVLETLPPKFQLMHRIIEELAALRADETMVRRLCRLLDQGKAAVNSIGQSALAETMGRMGTIARRGGGLQMKVRGLREGLGSLKINYEGALRALTVSVPKASEVSRKDPSPSGPGTGRPGDRR